MDKSLIGDKGEQNIQVDDGFVRVRGAREHNLKDVSLEIPRNALVVFTGVSGSGKSSLAFGTLYAEAQRRYLEFVLAVRPAAVSSDGGARGRRDRGASAGRRAAATARIADDAVIGRQRHHAVQPAADAVLARRRLSAQATAALCRSRSRRIRPRALVRTAMASAASMRSTNARWFPTTPDHPRARRRRVADRLARPEPERYSGDPRLRRRQAVARTSEEGPGLDPVHRRTADGAGLRRIYAGRDEACAEAEGRAELSGHLHRRAQIRAADLRHDAKRDDEASGRAISVERRLPGLSRQAAASRKPLSVKFAGLDIAEISRLPLKRLARVAAAGSGRQRQRSFDGHPEKALVVQRIVEDLSARLEVLLDLGLGYLTLERSTPTLSPGELQRLRLATQVRSNLFGVVYVLDEPSAGLHPADTEALLRALDRLKSAGNSLFVVEHELDVVRHADWIVDVGPDAGEQGGRIMYSGPLAGLKDVEASRTRPYLCGQPGRGKGSTKPPRMAQASGVTRNNLDWLNTEIPLGVFTSVTGISGSGK